MNLPHKDNSKILIASHDAGGAQVISSWVQQNPNFQYKFYLEGPAENIFSKLNYPDSAILKKPLNLASENFDFILAGTSWASQLEKEILLEAKHYKVYSISFLDHWTNYLERFQFNNNYIFPNEIWVGDEYAYRMAKTLFPPHIILKQVENPYLISIKKKIQNKNAISNNEKTLQDFYGNILYVTEPIAEHSLRQYNDENFLGYTEFNALSEFLTFIQDKNFNQIRIRFHPSEKDPDKYRHILNLYKKIPIEISSASDLLDDCLWSHSVVGCESMALVVGLFVGKNVFSCIPKNGRTCQLPHKEIMRIF